jgi:hypothetical protein
MLTCLKAMVMQRQVFLQETPQCNNLHEVEEHVAQDDEENNLAIGAHMEEQ